ncbi:hypothetical protein B0H13DRAFT_2555311 [Mycena leptocephala]|nr:hypothetical protein B0H13DRAFT_2555311 [Mycena leptocephala]
MTLRQNTTFPPVRRPGLLTSESRHCRHLQKAGYRTRSSTSIRSAARTRHREAHLPVWKSSAGYSFDIDITSNRSAARTRHRETSSAEQEYLFSFLVCFHDTAVDFYSLRRPHPPPRGSPLRADPRRISRIYIASSVAKYAFDFLELFYAVPVFRLSLQASMDSHGSTSQLVLSRTCANTGTSPPSPSASDAAVLAGVSTETLRAEMVNANGKRARADDDVEDPAKRQHIAVVIPLLSLKIL